MSTMRSVPMTPSQRVRQRLLDWMHQRRISQRSILSKLTLHTGEEWSQSRLHKVLSGRVELKIDDVAAIARAVDMTLVELVREPGYELVADLTPTELRLLDGARQNPHLTPAILQLIRPASRKPSHRMIKQRMAEDDD